MSLNAVYTTNNRSKSGIEYDFETSKEWIRDRAHKGYPKVLIATLRPRLKKAGISKSVDDTLNSSSQLEDSEY